MKSSRALYREYARLRAKTQLQSGQVGSPATTGWSGRQTVDPFPGSNRTRLSVTDADTEDPRRRCCCCLCTKPETIHCQLVYIQTTRIVFAVAIWRPLLLNRIEFAVIIKALLGPVALVRGGVGYSHQTFLWSICRSVGLSVSNGGSDPDAVWHHRPDRSRDEADNGVCGSVHGKGYFCRRIWARHCNQWRLHGVRVRQRLKRRSCRLGWCVRWAEALLYYMGSTSYKGKGEFGGLFHIFTMGNASRSPMVKCFWFVYENLTFPFGKRIIRKLDSWAFSDIFGFKTKVGVYEKLAKKVTILLPKLRFMQQNDAAYGALTAAAAADGQLAYSWMHATAQCCSAHDPDSPPRRGPVPKLLWADLLTRCFCVKRK